MEADEVLPYRSTLTITFDIGRPACLAVASMIRRLAWWGTSKSTWSAVTPARRRASSQASAIASTAALNTSRPAIFM